MRFGALGGAVSTDRIYRREGQSWWPQEVTTRDDLDRLGHGRLDVLLTHDAPASARIASDHHTIGVPGLLAAADTSAV